jgi:hypothetical protein
VNTPRTYTYPACTKRCTALVYCTVVTHIMMSACEQFFRLYMCSSTTADYTPPQITRVCGAVMSNATTSHNYKQLVFDAAAAAGAVDMLEWLRSIGVGQWDSESLQERLSIAGMCGNLAAAKVCMSSAQCLVVTLQLILAKVL